jgi:hypothetical protein
VVAKTVDLNNELSRAPLAALDHEDD